MRRALCATAIVIACANASAWSAVTYGIMELPLPDGVTSMSVQAQSETGSALGGYASSGCWFYNGSWDLIASGLSPRDVSRTGYIACYRAYDMASVVRVSNGSASVRDLFGDDYATAYGVNDLGLFTGYTDVSATDRRAFVYDWSVGTTYNLPTYDLPGSNAGVADLMAGYAVNNAGQVVGLAKDGGWGDIWVWTEADGVQSLGLCSAYTGSVWDLSENGIVVGEYNGQIYRKVIGEASWTLIPMAASAYRGGVNDAGIIVSGSNIYIDGAVQSITSLLAGTGGYSNFTLLDIDNRGTIIATASNGTRTVPLLLTPTTVGGNAVINSTFDTLDDVSIVAVGAASAIIVTDPDDPGNSCVELTTGSPVSIDQTVDTPSGAFEISFDYRFDDADATIALVLNGEQLDLIGPSDAATGWINYGYLVTDASLLGLDDVVLRLTLDGASAGLVALVDNLQIQSVPEPATMGLLALGAVALLRRRRRA